MDPDKFERGMREIEALMGLKNTHAQLFKQDLFTLSQQEDIELSDLTEAVYRAVSSGMLQTFTSSEHLVGAQRLLALVLHAHKLSTVVLNPYDLNLAIDTLTCVINSYGLLLSEMETVADQLLMLAKHSAAPPNELFSLLPTLLPLTGMIGFDRDFIFMRLIIWTQSGLPVSKAVSDMASIIRTSVGACQRSAKPDQKSLVRRVVRWVRRLR